MFLDVRDEPLGEARRAAAAELGLLVARDDRGDEEPVTRGEDVVLADDADVQEPGPQRRVLEVALHELARRCGLGLERAPARAAPREERPALGGWERRGGVLRRHDVAEHLAELGVEPPVGAGVPAREPRDRLARALEVQVDREHPPVRHDLREVHLGVDHLHAVPRQLEVAEPRHRGHAAQEDRVGVVTDTGERGIRIAHERTAGPLEALDREHAEPGAAEVGLEDQAVVARSEDEAVPVARHGAVRLARGPGAVARPPCRSRRRDPRRSPGRSPPRRGRRRSRHAPAA